MPEVRPSDLEKLRQELGRRLTSDAEEGLTNGAADFIAAEELERNDGHWWSPDGERIAFVRADSRAIAEYTIVHQGMDAVDVERHRYPFAGDPNALVRLGAVELESGATTWMDLGAELDIYLARVNWAPDWAGQRGGFIARPYGATVSRWWRAPPTGTSTVTGCILPRTGRIS